jgi:DNA polymerase-3 subunit epsilon
VLDLETTGLSGDCEVVAVAVVGSAGDVLLDVTVRPKRGIPAEARRVHGLGDADVADAPDLALVHPELCRIARDRTVVAFNAEFDRTVLEGESRRLGLPPVAARWECALQRYAEWRGFRASLATICEIEGIPMSERHRARKDAELTWLLVKRMVG